MIAMKGFFLFIVINVFVWNSIEDVRPYQLQIAKIMNELKMGEDVKILMISNLFSNMERNKYNLNLMCHLSMKYHKFGFRVLSFQDLEGIELKSNKRFTKLMKSKIVIISSNIAQELWKSMNNEEYQRFVYHTFVLDTKGNVIDRIYDDIEERRFIEVSKMWMYIKSVYEFEVQNYEGVSIPIDNYRNKVLILSFLVEGPRNKFEKLQSLQQLANKFNGNNFKILVILGTWVVEQLKDHINSMINNNPEANIHLFINTDDAHMLHKFVISNVQDVIHPSERLIPYYIKDFIISNNGDVTTGYEGISTIEMFEKISEKLVTMEQVVNTDQIESSK